MSTQAHYLAISLGPIYDTITQARKTRELWTASYLFSQLMKQLHKGCDAAGWRVLSPQLPENFEQLDLFGAGIFPDRLYAILPAGDQIAVEECIDAAVGRLAKMVDRKKNKENSSGDATRYEIDRLQYWKNYFRIVYVLAEVTTIEASGKILSVLNDRLDTLELQPAYFAEPPRVDRLTELLNHPYRTELAQMGLRREAGGNSVYASITASRGEIERFPSTAEISSLQLFQTDPVAYRDLQARAVAGINDEDEDVIDTRLDSSAAIEAFYISLFEAGKPAAPGEEAFVDIRKKAQDYHKYFCIVHADGDSFGKVNDALGNDAAKIVDFSKKLANYTAASAGVINAYGGKPVYIGGDDLVFFAPLVAQQGEVTKTVFDLLSALDRTFEQLDLGEGVSLSYGLTVSYYKFPLFEARDLSYNQLFGRAKKTAWNGRKKNSVAFRFLKHSGSYFEGLLSKEILTEFNDLAAALLSPALRGSGDGADLLSSTAFKLQELEDLLNTLQQTDRINNTDESDGLDHLFINFFNEPIHQRYHDQLGEIKSFVRLNFTEKGEFKEKPIQVTDNVYALLRLLNFMTPKSK